MNRTNWQPEFVDGFVTNGCLPMDEQSEEIQAELAASAVGIDNYLMHYASGDMPVVKFDDAFEAWLTRRCKVLDILREERLQNLLPWDVLRSLPTARKKSNRLYFSQGGLPTCMGHADAFGLASSTLSGIAQGLPLVYESFNPIVTWSISKGGSTRGGQTVTEMAKASNKIGHFPESCVGTNNLNIPDYARFSGIALQHQAGIVFLPEENLSKNIARCCRAGLGVACGNSTAVYGSTRDSNGVKIAQLGGYWAHATSFTGYREIKKTEYVFWVNSHGPKFGQSDEGEPADGAWMRVDKELAVFCSTMLDYGPPYAILPEGVIVRDPSHKPSFVVPFPSNWKG